MSEPHHYVFYVLNKDIIKCVKMEAVLGHLVSKKVIPDSDVALYRDRPRSGMNILIGYLKNQSFETFLSFVECIFEGQRDAPAKVQAVPVVESMIRAVQDFDAKNQTTHAERVVVIQEKYLKQLHTETQSAASATSSVTSFLDMPDLDYIEGPIQVSFQSSGREFLDFDRTYGFSLSVPPMAVPKGQEVIMKVGLCCYGPFSISEQYLLASDFAVVVTDRDFTQPVTVTMEHCLVLPEYERNSNVVILKANHRKITEDGLYTFEQFVIPTLHPNTTKLSFDVERFCILCAVLDAGERATVPSLSLPSHKANDLDSSSLSDDAHSPQLLQVESASTYSVSIETGTFSSSAAHDLSVRLSRDDIAVNHFSPTCEQHNSTARRTRKRTRDSEQDGDVIEEHKRHCGVEYAAVLFQNMKRVIDPPCEYKFAIFIITNCPVANKMCMKHAKEILGSDIELSMVPMSFKEALAFELIMKCSGWSVTTDKSPQVTLSEVQFHTMTRSDLFERLKLRTCPPRLLFTAESGGGGSKKFSCKVTIRGAVTAETSDEVFFNIKATPPTPTFTSQINYPPLSTSDQSWHYHHAASCHWHGSFDTRLQKNTFVDSQLQPPFHNSPNPANYSSAQPYCAVQLSTGGQSQSSVSSHGAAEAVSQAGWTTSVLSQDMQKLSLENSSLFELNK